MHLRAGIAALGLGFAMVMGSAGEAQAALTSSERGQIRDYISRGEAQNAGRVRALVARTDLTVEESISALTEAVSIVPFTDNRAAFLREMTFGVASAASRPLLANAVVRALCARADAVLQKVAGGLDHEPGAIAELSAIYGFIDGVVAGGQGVSVAAQTETSDTMSQHLDRNPRWLKTDGSVPEMVGRLRAQAQIALIDLLPTGTTRNVVAADRLGITGARRQMLIEWGVLLQDAGAIDNAGAERVRQVLLRIPSARAGLELLYAGTDRGPLRAHGGIAAVSTHGDDKPFGSELTPLTVDLVSSGVTQDLATLAVNRALAAQTDLRALAQQDSAATQGDPGKILGHARAPSADHIVGAAAQLLLIDAPRALDLAFVRALGGRPESAALLSDAIGALAGTEPTLDVGKAGGTTTTKMSAIHRAANGAVLGFTLEGHVWSIDRFAPSWAVSTITRDAQPLSLAQLPTARTPLRDGTSWTDGKVTLTRLHGAPRVGFAPTDKGTSTIKMAGVGGRGYDVVTMPAPGDDFVLDADLDIQNGPGGIAFRATNGKDSMHGAILLVSPGSRAALVTIDETGGESLLGAPIEPVPGSPMHVKITVKGTKLDVVCGGKTLSATLPAGIARGDLGVVAKRGALVDVASLNATKK